MIFIFAKIPTREIVRYTWRVNHDKACSKGMIIWEKF